MRAHSPRHSLLLAALLAGALLDGTAHAKGQLTKVAAFSADGSELNVMTFEDEGKRVGLLGIITGGARNAFTFNLAELPALVELWKKALAGRSPSWSAVGSMSETDTSDRSRLTLKSGPGVQLVIDSPKGPTETFTLSNAETARFEEALGKAKAILLAAPVK